MAVVAPLAPVSSFMFLNVVVEVVFVVVASLCCWNMAAYGVRWLMHMVLGTSRMAACSCAVTHSRSSAPLRAGRLGNRLLVPGMPARDVVTVGLLKDSFSQQASTPVPWLL